MTDRLKSHEETPGWVLAERFAVLTGHSVNAVKIKRVRGIWPDGTITQVRGGRLYVNVPAYDRWVATGKVAA